MVEDSKAPVKVCPVCLKKYPEEDNYCGLDGTPLAAAEPETDPAASQPDRDLDAS